MVKSKKQEAKAVRRDMTTIEEIKDKYKAYLQIYFCSGVDGMYKHWCKGEWKPDPANWAHSAIVVQCISRLYWAYTGVESIWCNLKARPKPQSAVFYIFQNKEDLDKREYTWLLEKQKELKVLYPDTGVKKQSKKSVSQKTQDETTSQEEVTQ